MSNTEKEALMARLKELGGTAPGNTGIATLRSKIAELEAAQEMENSADDDQAEDQADIQDGSEDAELGEDQDESEGENLDEDEGQDEDPEENLDDDEAGDGKIKIEAKVDFSNENLGIDRKEKGDRFYVSPDLAEFLVKTDRTCRYVNQ